MEPGLEGGRQVHRAPQPGCAASSSSSANSPALLDAEDPSSDPAVSRLFPPAYPDDLLQNLEFETSLGAAPRSGSWRPRHRGAHRERVDADRGRAPRVDRRGERSRLVLGTRIEITEEATDEDFPADDPRHETYRVYQFLGFLLQELLEGSARPTSMSRRTRERTQSAGELTSGGATASTTAGAAVATRPRGAAAPPSSPDARCRCRSGRARRRRAARDLVRGAEHHRSFTLSVLRSRHNRLLVLSCSPAAPAPCSGLERTDQMDLEHVRGGSARGHRRRHHHGVPLGRDAGRTQPLVHHRDHLVRVVRPLRAVRLHAPEQPVCSADARVRDEGVDRRTGRSAESNAAVRPVVV